MKNLVKISSPEKDITRLGDLVKGQIFTLDNIDSVYIISENLKHPKATCVQVTSLQTGSRYSLDRTGPCNPIPPYATITIRTYL